MTAAQSDRKVALAAGDSCLVARFGAMASPCEVLIETRDRDTALQLAQSVADEAWRIEDKFSRYRGGNVIDQINSAAGATIEVDEETALVLDFAQTLYELSDGSFDITSGVLREVWRFDGSDNVPEEGAIRRVMQRVGWHRVRWERPRLRMEPGMQIDFGGIGKEYAVDRCAVLLRDMSEIACLVNFGGDLATSRRPSQHPAGWRVGIEALDQAARSTDRTLALALGGLATSGDSGRFLLRDGVRYGHILDTRTGWPVPDAPRSITVAAESCTLAGMLSTLAMLKGAQAEKFLSDQKVQFWCNRGAGATA
jgi:thiamine biosynthesis lipoprotein